MILAHTVLPPPLISLALYLLQWLRNAQGFAVEFVIRSAGRTAVLVTVVAHQTNLGLNALFAVSLLIQTVPLFALQTDQLPSVEFAFP